PTGIRSPVGSVRCRAGPAHPPPRPPHPNGAPAVMKLSIVELGTVAPGTTEADALADVLETARHAEAHGFHRIWFAEHHVTTSFASHHPELLIAAASTVTSRIRLGSGSVL